MAQEMKQSLERQDSAALFTLLGEYENAPAHKCMRIASGLMRLFGVRPITSQNRVSLKCSSRSAVSAMHITRCSTLS